MKLIIEIKDTTYKAIKTLLIISQHLQKEVMTAIENGTPIPKEIEPLITKLIEDAKEVENG